MLENWFLRHQDRSSRALHAVGIPLTILAAGLVIAAITTARHWLYAMAAIALIVGYALQFIGHAIEGNDPGEIVLIKRLLGRPYKAIADKSPQQPTRERPS